MRIWLVTRDGRSPAVFSTAGDARDYVVDNGGPTCCDVECFVLDARMRTQQFFAMPRRAALAAEPGR
jgi:hypothetical protein